MTNPAKAIRIGTMIKATEGGAAERIAKIADMGFESFEPFFWQSTRGQDLAELGKRCREAIGDRDITISTLGMFGNPLETTDIDRDTLQGWKDCIDNAHHFGATCVAGFTGRIRNKPLTDSLPRYREIVATLQASAPTEEVERAIWFSGWASGMYNNGAHWAYNEVPVVLAPPSAWGR